MSEKTIQSQSVRRDMYSQWREKEKEKRKKKKKNLNRLQEVVPGTHFEDLIGHFQSDLLFRRSFVLHLTIRFQIHP
jgi:hypothetical protein